jgi:adenylate cyclase
VSLVPTPRLHVACAYAQLELADEALDCLERGTLNGAGHRAWMENDPDLNALRGHPRFQAILDRI